MGHTAKVYELRQKIAQFMQGNQPFAMYYSSSGKLWDELEIEVGLIVVGEEAGLVLVDWMLITDYYTDKVSSSTSSKSIPSSS